MLQEGGKMTGNDEKHSKINARRFSVAPMLDWVHKEWCIRHGAACTMVRVGDVAQM